MLCDYGCDKEAKFQMKNGKWCCESHFRKCIIFKQKISKINTGKKHKKHKSSRHEKPILISNINNIFCSYCCKKEAKYQLKNGKYCCEESTSKCIELKRKNRESNLGEKNGFFGQKHSKESKEKMSKGHTGIEITPERNKKISLSNQGIKRSEEVKEKQRLRMKNGMADYIKSFPTMGFKNHQEWLLNGGVKYISSFIKKISNEELKIRELVKELYPTCEFQHPVFRYSLDVAIPEYKIAIEYDGYYHFDTEEHKQYHKQRQEKIEYEGWKFLRYTMFDKFPNLEQIKNDIQRLLC